MTNRTQAQIQQELRAVFIGAHTSPGVDIVAEDIHIETDDHGCTTKQAVICVDGDLWAADVYVHPQDGIQDVSEPYRVRAVETLVIEYQPVAQ